MGEAKNRAPKLLLTSEEREAALGNDPFTPAYDMVFDIVNASYSQTGGMSHLLLGIEFEAGKPCGVNALAIRRPEDVSRLLVQMLERWPMVGHVFEAWIAPDASMSPHAHPLRKDVVSVMLHTSDMAASASCCVDAEKKTVQRAELIFVDQVGGRFGRELPTRH